MQIGTKVRLTRPVDGARTGATGTVTWIQMSQEDPWVVLRKVRMDAVEGEAGPQEILARAEQLEETAS